MKQNFALLSAAFFLCALVSTGHAQDGTNPGYPVTNPPPVAATQSTDPLANNAQATGQAAQTPVAQPPPKLQVYDPSLTAATVQVNTPAQQPAVVQQPVQNIVQGQGVQVQAQGVQVQGQGGQIQGQGVQVVATPAPVSALIPNADEMPIIYNAMMASGRLENMSGHTVAASQLVTCLPGLTPVQKAQALMNIVGALSRSRLRVVNQAFAYGVCDNAQITVIAAVLACKIGPRSPDQIVQNLTVAYQELLNRFNYVNELYQVEVAARLMN